MRCVIVVKLPAGAKDVFVDGNLLKKGASNEVRMVTPRLGAGPYRCLVEIRDTYNDGAAKKKIQLTNIIPGATVTADFFSLALASQ